MKKVRVPRVGIWQWIAVTLLLLAIVAAGTMSNITLSSVGKNLPATLLSQLSNQVRVLEILSEVVTAAELSEADPRPENFNRLRGKVEIAYQAIVDLRETYDFDNLIQASAFHAAVAPAVADVRLWLTEGVSGYGPESDLVNRIVLARISKAFQKGRTLNRESYHTAINILNAERRRLDRFLYGVNLLFILTLLVIMAMFMLLIRQTRLQGRTLEARTEQRRAEESLYQSEQRFRQLAELLPQIVFEMDIKGQVTFVNKCAYEAFGYAADEFSQGLPAEDMIAVDERAWVTKQIQGLIHGELDIMGESYTALRKDGTTFPFQAYCSLIRTDDRVVGVRGIIIDMTEQIRLREEKDRIEEQYSQSQKMEAVGRLAGGVAHDLNNMLSPILAYSELVLNKLSEDDPNRKLVKRVHQAGMRSRDLISQLLAFSRKQALDAKPLDLNSTIDNFKKLLRRTIREDILIDTFLTPDLPLTKADLGQVEQVIMNLVVNAQDAMPNGGRLTIETEVVELDQAYAAAHRGVKPGAYVLLCISDSGRGMDAETRQRIFEPFFTTKGQGQGTGLGLATVYGIVKQHGGNVWVYSELGRGTTFKCYFPVTKTAPSQAAPSKKATPDLRGAEWILVVEDNEEVRELAVDILTQFGYQVSSAANGEECLRLLESMDQAPNLLLTDVVMPGMNGRELYERVSARYPDIKVLFMSGYTGNVIVHHGVLDDGIAFLQKPFSVKHLATRVREVLDG